MHKPVMVQEMIDVLQPKDGCVYIDATFGGGGYSKAIKAVAPKAKIIAFDRDPMIQKTQTVEKYADIFHCDTFSHIAEYVNTRVDGVVFDFGVSSFQIDEATRGFSFQKEGPLDMRMSQEGLSAADVVNTFSEKELADIIYYYGDETRSYRVADAIVKNRPFSTTLQLANVVAKVVPKGKIHPATKTFQALRIFVNNELEEIKKGAEGALSVLKDGGKLIAITFHGLEDRALKEATKDLKEKAKLFPSKTEIRENVRARSAKLRWFEKMSQGKRPSWRAGHSVSEGGVAIQKDIMDYRDASRLVMTEDES
ncbi:MAG: 16S rRNA (cytosine(1402)-N(4))-methyltransferase RsmH [Alphaproteobacteria bacterium]|nr:MAG: 16S rRNA (cytosine(1402)-N(4))-methyltransferase RsmH [Alphaproteobacteria bacterium]